ncbi:MAG: hypothetical protein OCD02_06780 [Spirochaetaceae bacterium]
MKILEIPFEFNIKEFNRRVKIELYEGMEDEIEELLKNVIPLVSAKAIFIESKITPEENIITIGSQIFKDEVLTKKLQDNSIVFPYIVTCGTGLENLEDYKNDMLAEYWLDAIKQMAMDSAFDYFRDYIKSKYKIDKLYSMNPGSDVCGDGWDFTDQKKLFNLFPNITENIGVTLSESLLMSPNKTVSGIIFESDKDFVSCLECSNTDCQNRRIIHDGSIM